MSNTTDDSELREQIASLKFSGYAQVLIQLTDKELSKIMELITQHTEKAVKEAVEDYEKINHIGKPYEENELTKNYIINKRVRKVGKNWIFIVTCRYCGNKMLRGTNKFKAAHQDCSKWGDATRLTQLKDTNLEKGE